MTETLPTISEIKSLSQQGIIKTREKEEAQLAEIKDKVIRHIRTAASNGKYYVNISNIRDNEGKKLVEWLKKEGYHVAFKPLTQSLEISW